MARKRIVIMGAAGRDFHNFQVCFRDDASVEVVAFTATQIPGIENRIFPFPHPKATIGTKTNIKENHTRKT